MHVLRKDSRRPQALAKPGSQPPFLLPPQSFRLPGLFQGGHASPARRDPPRGLGRLNDSGHHIRQGWLTPKMFSPFSKKHGSDPCLFFRMGRITSGEHQRPEPRDRDPRTQSRKSLVVYRHSHRVDGFPGRLAIRTFAHRLEVSMRWIGLANVRMRSSLTGKRR